MTRIRYVGEALEAVRDLGIQEDKAFDSVQGEPGLSHSSGMLRRLSLYHTISTLYTFFLSIISASPLGTIYKLVEAAVKEDLKRENARVPIYPFVGKFRT